MANGHAAFRIGAVRHGSPKDPLCHRAARSNEVLGDAGAIAFEREGNFPAREAEASERVRERSTARVAAEEFQQPKLPAPTRVSTSPGVMERTA